MRKKLKLFLSTVAVCSVCCAIFVGVGYFYLNSKIENVQQNTLSVPYYSQEPDNVGVMIEIGQHKTFFFLDFYYKSISVIFDADDLTENGNILGYQVDHYILADYSLLSGIIDIVGGIELETEGEALRYTGVQITDMLSTSTDYDRLERTVITKIMKKISENGFQKDDFLYIIENSDTTLTVPVCYYWSDYIKELCDSVNEVN